MWFGHSDPYQNAGFPFLSSIVFEIWLFPMNLTQLKSIPILCEKISSLGLIVWSQWPVPKCRIFLSKFNSFRDIPFSDKHKLAQVHTNHVWKNQLSRSNGLVTVIRTINAGFSSLGSIIFEISFFQQTQPIAQVDTNHVWKNQLSSLYGSVTKLKKCRFLLF